MLETTIRYDEAFRLSYRQAEKQVRVLDPMIRRDAATGREDLYHSTTGVATSDPPRHPRTLDAAHDWRLSV